jgi:hypothetical protein
MRLLISALLLLGTSAAAFATGQIPDVIRVGRAEYPLFSNPLEKLYQTVRRPDFTETAEASSSGNWRGYVARWTIDGDRLYLTDIRSYIRGKRITLRQLFPGRVRDRRVLADWYSGSLRVPDGKQLQYVHMGYGSTYERDIIYHVKQGRVISRRTLDNRRRPVAGEWEKGKEELRKLERWEKRIRR